MAERDAFGNLVDEDPIAAMGWAAPKGAVTRPQAIQRRRDPDLGEVQARLAAGRDDAGGGLAAAANESFGEVVRVGRSAVRARRAQGTAAQAFGRGPRRLGGLLRLVAALLVLAWILPVGAIVDGVRDTAGGVEQVRENGPLPEVQPPAAAGAELLRTAGFTRALAAVREQAGAGSRPTLLRVDAGTLDAQVLTRDGGLRGISFRDGTASVAYDTPGAGAGNASRAFAWSAVDPRAPSRLARAVDGMTYAVLSRTPDLGWAAFAGEQAHLAGPDGRDPEPV